ncbi:MAG: hypothetical protein MN733_22895, partial [Nitrososphaera sp.]|nr:hypothetical protein [Nitrososphaera sp.]
MSKFFEPVEFELDPDPGLPAPPPPPVKYDKEKVKVACEKIRQEFERIRTGTSDLTSYAIDPGR